MENDLALKQGKDIINNQELWSDVIKANQSLQLCGEHLAQFINVNLGTEILVACNVDDADTLADSVINTLEKRFPESPILLSCAWTTIGENDSKFCHINKQYQEKNKGDCSIVAVTTGHNKEEFDIFMKILLRNLTGKKYQSDVYILSPIIQTDWIEGINETFSNLYKLHFISFEETKNLRKKFSWYFRSIEQKIDHNIEQITVPKIVTRRRAINFCN